MGEKSELLNKIRVNLTALERQDKDEFDSVANSLSLLQLTVDLLTVLYDNKKIKEWKERDDPAFYRFASKLKVGLELQRDYLSTISDILVSNDDAVAQKIIACKEQINSVVEKENSILREIEPLLEKENELSSNQERLDSLLDKQRALKKIEKKLSEINLDELSAEVQEMEKAKAELEAEYQPLLDKRQILTEEVTGLRGTVQNLSGEINQLEGAFGEDVIKLAETIPKWIQQIKVRKAIREEKLSKYVAKLEKESEELKKVENQLQEHIQKINEFVSLCMTNQEIFRVHFQSNKALSNRFSKSLPDMNHELIKLNETTKKELKKFDESLSRMQRKNEEISTDFKPIHLGR